MPMKRQIKRVNLSIICTCCGIKFGEEVNKEMKNTSNMTCLISTGRPFTAIFLLLSVNSRSLYWFCEAFPEGNESRCYDCCNMACCLASPVWIVIWLQQISNKTPVHRQIIWIGYVCCLIIIRQTYSWLIVSSCIGKIPMILYSDQTWIAKLVINKDSVTHSQFMSIFKYFLHQQLYTNSRSLSMANEVTN